MTIGPARARRARPLNRLADVRAQPGLTLSLTVPADEAACVVGKWSGDTIEA